MIYMSCLRINEKNRKKIVLFYADSTLPFSDGNRVREGGAGATEGTGVLAMRHVTVAL